MVRNAVAAGRHDRSLESLVFAIAIWVFQTYEITLSHPQMRTRPSALGMTRTPQEATAIICQPMLNKITHH